MFWPSVQSHFINKFDTSSKVVSKIGRGIKTKKKLKHEIKKLVFKIGGLKLLFSQNRRTKNVFKPLEIFMNS
jgi:hypothetical protein